MVFDRVFRPVVKNVYQNINFLISQPKHMLWVLKRRVSLSQLFGAPKTWVRKYLQFYAYNFCLSKPYMVLIQCQMKVHADLF